MGWVIFFLILFALVLWAAKRKGPSSRRRVTSQRGAVKAEFSDDGWLTIDAIDYFGQYVRSPNGRYALSWVESPFIEDENGNTRKIPGKYLLLDGDKIILKGRMARPNDGVVSNVGVFAINDWTFSEGLAGVLNVISPTGEALLKKRFRANLNNCGISSDGRFAVCQTCNSDYDAHSGMLFFFDVSNRKLLWKKAPETGWASGYEFDTQNKILYLCYEGLGKYRYSFDGKCLDEERWRVEWRRKRLENPSGYDLLDIAEEKMKEVEAGDGCASDYSEIESMLKRAAGMDVSPNTKAQIHRRLGEIAEKQGRVQDAIAEYENALRWNPKVGVKRRLSKLRPQRR